MHFKSLSMPSQTSERKKAMSHLSSVSRYLNYVREAEPYKWLFFATGYEECLNCSTDACTRGT